MISIIIATFNESQYIINCLKSLIHSAEQAKYRDYEVIVIDNNSTDETQNVVSSFIKNKPKFKLITEKIQGPGAARNAGIEISKGEYIAFVDGDAKVTEPWFEMVNNIIFEKEPEVFGGPIYPYYVDERPDWFKDKYEIRIHHNGNGFLQGNEVLSGSNMIMKRKAFDDVGGFITRLGPMGNTVSYGDDTELVQRLKTNGYKVYYDIDLIVEHVVPEFKMHLMYFLASYYQKGIVRYDMEVEAGKKNTVLRDSDTELEDIYKMLENVIATIPTLLKQYREGKTDQTQEELLVEVIAPRFNSLGYAIRRYRERTGMRSKPEFSLNPIRNLKSVAAWIRWR